jgi:hypothetical protein
MWVLSDNGGNTGTAASFSFSCAIVSLLHLILLL